MVRSSSTLVVVMCVVALAVALPTALACDEPPVITSPCLAEACNELLEPLRATHAVEECKATAVSSGVGDICSHVRIFSNIDQSTPDEDLEDYLAKRVLFHFGTPEGAARTFCALLPEKKSLAAACKAADEALDESPEAFQKLCEAAFKALCSYAASVIRGKQAGGVFISACEGASEL